MPKMKKVWIGAGGNVGDVKATLALALRDIENDKHNSVTRVSSFYLTKAWGNEDQDDFINIAFEIKTSLEPEALLYFCQEIERKYKRERLIKWGPRTLDLDLLIYENIENYHSTSLTLPHSFVTQRGFVLEPLKEIAPSLVIDRKTVLQWAQSLKSDDIQKLETKDNWWKI